MNRKRIVATVLIGVGVVVAGAYAWSRRDAGALLASGTIEARNIRVGSKIGGRILEVRVREGDRVEPGQVLVTFDDRELKATLEQSQANYEKLQRGNRPEEIAQARAQERQSLADYELKRTGYRKEDIEAARADLAKAKADAVRAELDYKRAKDLADAGIFSRQQKDLAEATWKMNVAQSENTQQKLDAFEHGFRPEEIASAKAQYERSRASREEMERGFRREDVDLGRAQFALDEAKYREREVLAPASATVEVLDVRPGDLVAPNTPLATLLERDQLYIRIYVPETQIGLVRVGQKAEIRVNSFPNDVFEGVIEQINQKAEFLPRNVQTREERVHQMFGVKVRVNDPSGRIRAGMAADLRLKLAEK
jgi:HlyD family secretion protein